MAIKKVLPFTDERKAVALLLKKHGSASVLWFNENTQQELAHDSKES